MKSVTPIRGDGVQGEKWRHGRRFVVATGVLDARTPILARETKTKTDLLNAEPKLTDSFRYRSRKRSLCCPMSNYSCAQVIGDQSTAGKVM